MARLRHEHLDFETAENVLRGRADVGLSLNTTLRRTERPGSGPIAVRLYSTDVVTFLENGDIILNAGGYRTTTTKDRINRVLPLGWRVYSKDWDWYVHTPAGVFEFYDGMHFTGSRAVNG